MKDVTSYDPAEAPDSEGWLDLDEAERLDLVMKSHRKAREQLPNLRLHATIHVVVENQVALGAEIPVQRTVERLQAEGLNRHDAVHAVGSVLAKHMFDVMKGDVSQDDPNVAYWAELEELSAVGWRRAR